MSIRILPVNLINKIAAGEVIDRPASIVKELMENALDAGATRIDVAVEDGGKRLVSIADDGCGMAAEDLALAFSPHATSKIASEDELFNISTLGFRGEALASVASISHAHIRTRRRDDESGYELAASAAQIGNVSPCAAAPGTTATARDLFYNTPARRKFMRTTNTEFGHVTEQITRLALPHPRVAFTLTHNGRQTQDLPAADSTASRIRDLFGDDLADSLIPIDCRKGPVGVAGLIAPPDAARASGKWQYFFLNGRFIRDRLLSHALREAYRGLLDSTRWPVAFIFIEMDPGEVDVNVHPTKIEVRFRDSGAVHGELLASLRATLNKADLSPSASTTTAAEAHREPDDSAAEQRRTSLHQAMADFFKSAPPPQPHLKFSERSHPPAPGGFASPPAQRAEHPPAVPPRETTSEPEHRIAPEAIPPPCQLPAAIQIHNSYIVAACEDGLVIVDQHALHERLIYNDIRRRLTAGPLTAQRLLIPETLKVTAEEAACIESRGELLARLGIEITTFGPGTVGIQRFPSLLAERGVAAGKFVRGFLDELAEDETVDSERLLEEVIQMMACKAAVKAGESLGPDEIDRLLSRLDHAEKGSFCPHGRPTTLKLTLKDLEKQFKRT